jgi:putative membrane protein
MLLAHPYAYDGAWWWFSPLIWLGSFILLFILIKALFWRRHHRHWHEWHQHGWRSESDPRTILAQRYARGEISESEYRDRLAVLTGPAPQHPDRR